MLCKNAKKMSYTLLTSIEMKNTNKMLTQDFLEKRGSVKHELIEPLPNKLLDGLISEEGY